MSLSAVLILPYTNEMLAHWDATASVTRDVRGFKITLRTSLHRGLNYRSGYWNSVDNIGFKVGGSYSL
jgi:hypothetical protein